MRVNTLHSDISKVSARDNTSSSGYSRYFITPHYNARPFRVGCMRFGSQRHTRGRSPPHTRTTPHRATRPRVHSRDTSRNAYETGSTHERRRSSFGSAPHHVCLHVVVRRARAAVRARVICRLLQSRLHQNHRLTRLVGLPGRVVRRPRPTRQRHQRQPSHRPSRA